MGIIIKCAKCGKEKEKSNGHYNYAVKTGKKMYCSNHCSQLDRVAPYTLTVNQEAVKRIFNYHADGYLTWAQPTTFRTKVGTIVGHKQLFVYKTRTEYRWVVRLDKKLYLLHQIIFLWHHGYIPKMIDHRDRNNLNNRIENLREATPSQNGCNKKSRGLSQYLGVYFNKKARKWVAGIKMDGKRKYLGSFDSEADAALKYNEFAKIVHGEFANLNIIKT